MEGIFGEIVKNSKIILKKFWNNFTDILGKPGDDLTPERPLRNVRLQKIIRLRKTLRKLAKWQKMFIGFLKNLVNL